MPENKTIKVRIAVAVMPDGRYSADGGTNSRGEQAVDGVLAKNASTMLCRVRNTNVLEPHTIYFVETEIPLPLSTTIQGTVTPSSEHPPLP
jgi:hypothetical protein